VTSSFASFGLFDAFTELDLAFGCAIVLLALSRLLVNWNAGVVFKILQQLSKGCYDCLTPLLATPEQSFQNILQYDARAFSPSLALPTSSATSSKAPRPLQRFQTSGVTYPMTSRGRYARWSRSRLRCFSYSKPLIGWAAEERSLCRPG